MSRRDDVTRSSEWSVITKHTNFGVLHVLAVLAAAICGLSRVQVYIYLPCVCRPNVLGSSVSVVSHTGVDLLLFFKLQTIGLVAVCVVCVAV